MKIYRLLLALFMTVAFFSCCQKDPSLESGSTDKNQSYIKFMGQRFQLTDGEFSYGVLSLFDQNDAHDYEIDIYLWNEDVALTSGKYTLTSSADNMGISKAAIELTENDTSATDSTQNWLGEYRLTSATMDVSCTDNIYTIAINGMTSDGNEVRAHYVGRLYFAEKKKNRKLEF